MKFQASMAIIGLLCVSIGVGVVFEWGAGLAVGGFGLWIDAQYGK